jgi:hypothetical protein
MRHLCSNNNNMKSVELEKIKYNNNTSNNINPILKFNFLIFLFKFTFIEPFNINETNK